MYFLSTECKNEIQRKLLSTLEYKHYVRVSTPILSTLSCVSPFPTTHFWHYFFDSIAPIKYGITTKSHKGNAILHVQKYYH